MKTFLRPFSLFRWFKKSSCQLLAKECALSTGNCLGGLPRNSVARLTDRARNDLKCVEGPWNRNQTKLLSMDFWYWSRWRVRVIGRRVLHTSIFHVFWCPRHSASPTWDFLQSGELYWLEEDPTQLWSSVLGKSWFEWTIAKYLSRSLHPVFIRRSIKVRN